LRNLSFPPLSVLLTVCNISGGGGSFNWDLPGKPEDYSYKDVGVITSHYRATGEYPQLCDCPHSTGNLHKKKSANAPKINRLSTELSFYKNEMPRNVSDNDEKIKNSSVNFM